MQTISEALNKLKNLKSRIARVEKYIDQSVLFYEDERPEYDYNTELQVRFELINSVRELKAQIQRTNAVTMVDHKGASLSLAELILVNADLRSELAFQQKQLDLSTSDEGRYYGKRTRDDIKKKFAEGYNKNKLRETISQLETSKEEVESLINSTNLKTKLVEA